MNRENSEENTVAEEEYEVERIVGHKVIKNRKQKKFSYFIKWLNYDDSDNTWEKEENVFAVDMIANYWNNISPSDPDRVLFEQLQAKKKDPIVLNSPQPKIAKVISHASPSPPSSPTLKPTADSIEENKGKSITNTITSFLFGDKKKDTQDNVSIITASGSSSSSSSSPSKTPAVVEQKKIDDLYKKVPSPPTHTSLKRKEREDSIPKIITPIVIDQEDEEDEDFSPATATTTTTTTTASEELEENSAEESAEDMIVEVEDDDEEETAPSRSATRKRTRSAYTDYFIEQHKKKKLYGDRKDTEDDEEDDGSVTSSIASSEKKTLKGTDTIIFDDSFAKDASLDWNTLAKKVEYIGREVENGPIYCVVAWEDNVRSFHSLELVRKKRPDLVIDAFVDLLNKT